MRHNFLITHSMDETNFLSHINEAEESLMIFFLKNFMEKNLYLFDKYL